MHRYAQLPRATSAGLLGGPVLRTRGRNLRVSGQNSRLISRIGAMRLRLPGSLPCRVHVKRPPCHRHLRLSVVCCRSAPVFRSVCRPHSTLAMGLQTLVQDVGHRAMQAERRMKNGVGSLRTEMVESRSAMQRVAKATFF